MEADATIHDLPDVILSNIFALISDIRTRNRLALVCRKFMVLERATRTSLTLRGNARNLFLLPTCFRSVTHLDLSFVSPWGHPFLCTPPLEASLFLAHRLFLAFPRVTSLTLYARSAPTLDLLTLNWPHLRHVKLVRWHQRPPEPPGAGLLHLFQHCPSLTSLDLSTFYCWTEDVPPALQSHPQVAASLLELDLLTISLMEGFKAAEIRAVVSACPNLTHFRVACFFDPRLMGSVGDDTLLAISAGCPKLSLLHLVDSSSLPGTRGNPDDDGLTPEDARIGHATWVEFFRGLPLLEELVLDVCKNVKDSGSALEALKSKCPKLRVLKLGQFHGICMAVESRLDGIALCQGLHSLSIKNSADLTDLRLIAIARGCSRLVKFEVQGCKNITAKGVGTMACLLHRTLVDVKISCCKNLDAALSLKALEPIRDRIRRLHIDCVWDSLEENLEMEQSRDHDAGASSETRELIDFFGSAEANSSNQRKKRKICLEDESFFYMQRNGSGFSGKTWDRLQYLSLWVGVGDVLTPLPMAGLDDCPELEEIRIKVEGDCRGRHKPSEQELGLSCLVQYPRLSKMQLDCGDTIGFALTAPSGQMDLSLWERFFLKGVATLNLSELDYWPPQDRDVNQRSLSLPAAGLLAECATLRKLFIHGTAHEHFLMFLPTIVSLRDVQLRADYYPAPENDMSTEMRADSYCRFEDALNKRVIED